VIPAVIETRHTDGYPLDLRTEVRQEGKGAVRDDSFGKNANRDSAT
jgi:hypothetical protein